jgi:ADP-ribosylglycohydrolase
MKVVCIIWFMSFMLCIPTVDGLPAETREEKQKLSLDDNALLDKIHGCLLGKCAGLNLGQAVEGWTKQQIEEEAKKVDFYPVTYYFPANFKTPYTGTLQGRFDHYPANDDTDLMTVSLLTLRKYGIDFTSRQLAEKWVEHVKFACTAEGVALNNFKQDVWPPQSAIVDNPYEQWIGAQMRAEIWGMIAPGQPQMAAELACRDASISHVRNGIYGSQYIAALVSLAMTNSDVKSIILNALEVIPEHSEYAIAVRDVVAWHEAGYDWQKTWQLLDGRYGWNDDGVRRGGFIDSRFNTKEGLYQWENMRWVHVTPNAAACVLALLYGDSDFSKSIGIAAMCGYDADCNAGTVGGVLGALKGQNAIPAAWKEPLHDRFMNGLKNCEAEMKISDMAKEIAGFAQQIQAAQATKQ